ncbi:membrane protein [Gordonia phage Alyssamiracle]|nr:membrane protein [Gordonia phage Rumi]WNM65382.1 membrane protein [Gordonia phage Alyssamiracle]
MSWIGFIQTIAIMFWFYMLAAGLVREIKK